MAKEESPEETYKPMTTSYQATTQDAGVVLIHHGNEFVDKMVDLLKCYEHKVMTVGMTSTYMTTLSNKNEKFDAIMINCHSLDFPSLRLLGQAVSSKIISLAVCDEHNEQHSVMKSLNIGTYIVVEQPLDEKIVDDLWQFVLRKKIKKEKAEEGLEENEVEKNVDDNGNNNIIGNTEEQDAKKNNVPKIEEQSNNIHEVENVVVSNEKCKKRTKRGMENMKVVNENIGKKSRTLWTDDLHAKFMKAVEHLGEGKCFPKQILEIMDVPDITRLQVASHLQKCRLKVPKALKHKHPSSSQGSASGSQRTCTFKKFGRMPPLQINISNEIQRGPEVPIPTLNTNNICARGENLVQQLYHRQQHIQFSTTNPINNPHLYIQSHVDSGIQQDSPFFRMPSREGLLIASIDNNHELIPNVMGDHAQNVGNSNEKKPYDEYFDFNNVHFNSDDMDFLRQFLESSSDFPNEQNGEFDQVYSDDQVSDLQYPFFKSSKFS